MSKAEHKQPTDGGQCSSKCTSEDPISEEYGLLNEDSNLTSQIPDHMGLAPLKKEYQENLIKALLAEKDIKILELKNKILEMEGKEQTQAEKTRFRLVTYLLKDFRIIMIGVMVLIFFASFENAFIDKEVIKNSVPLLINVVTGLVGAILGYYFSGNSSGKTQ